MGGLCTKPGTVSVNKSGQIYHTKVEAFTDIEDTAKKVQRAEREQQRAAKFGRPPSQSKEQRAQIIKRAGGAAAQRYADDPNADTNAGAAGAVSEDAYSNKDVAEPATSEASTTSDAAIRAKLKARLSGSKKGSTAGRQTLVTTDGGGSILRRAGNNASHFSAAPVGVTGDNTAAPVGVLTLQEVRPRSPLVFDSRHVAERAFLQEWLKPPYRGVASFACMCPARCAHARRFYAGS